MPTTGDDRGSGVVGPEAIERYEVEGVTYEVHPAARLSSRSRGPDADAPRHQRTEHQRTTSERSGEQRDPDPGCDHKRGARAETKSGRIT